MATHKSAAVAARQRVNDHLQQQIEALTNAVEAGLTAVEQVQSVQQERDRLLAELGQREQQATQSLATAVAQLQQLKKTRPEISELLGLTEAGIKLPPKSATQKAAIPHHDTGNQDAKAVAS